MDLKSFIRPIAILAIALLVAMLLVMNKPDHEIKTFEERMVNVDSIEVLPRSMPVYISTQGVVKPRTETTLLAEVGGKIVNRSAAFVEGAYIQQGQELLRIEAIDYEIAVVQAEADLARAQSQLAQEEGRGRVAEKEWTMRRDSAKASVAAKSLALRQPQIKEAKSLVAAAEANLKRAKKNLSRTIVTMPYDGVVQNRMADIGQFVGVGTSLGKTFAIDTAEVRLSISEGKIPYLDLPGVTRQGDIQAKVRLSYVTPQQTLEWSGKLSRTEGRLDEQSRTLYAVAEVLDPYGLNNEGAEPLRMGTFVRAAVEGKTFPNLVPLPRNILRPGNLIWVIDGDNRLQNRPVEILRTEGEEMLVSSGLTAGDIVCLTAVGNVLPGTPVNVQNARSQRTETAASNAAADVL